MIRTLEVRCSSLIARMRRWKGGSLFGSELVDVLRRRVYRPFPQSMQAKQGSCHCCRSTSILRSQCARYHRPSAFHFSPGINQRKEKKRKEGGVHIFSYFARSMLRSRLATSSCEFGFLIYLSFFRLCYIIPHHIIQSSSISIARSPRFEASLALPLATHNVLQSKAVVDIPVVSVFPSDILVLRPRMPASITFK